MEGTILARSGFRSASTTQLSSPQPTGLMCVMSASVVGKVYRSPPTCLLGFQGIGPKISNNSLANLAILINQATLHLQWSCGDLYGFLFLLAQSTCALYSGSLSTLAVIWSACFFWGGDRNCPQLFSKISQAHFPHFMKSFECVRTILFCS